AEDEIHPQLDWPPTPPVRRSERHAECDLQDEEDEPAREQQSRAAKRARWQRAWRRRFGDDHAGECEAARGGSLPSGDRTHRQKDDTWTAGAKRTVSGRHPAPRLIGACQRVVTKSAAARCTAPSIEPPTLTRSPTHYVNAHSLFASPARTNPRRCLPP